MTKLVVNTVGIDLANNKLRTANNAINQEFSTLQNRAKQLDNNWKSIAGDTARDTMHEIFKNNEARSAVLKEYINLLENKVNPGYIVTENNNTKLADQFKK